MNKSCEIVPTYCIIIIEESGCLILKNINI